MKTASTKETGTGASLPSTDGKNGMDLVSAPSLVDKENLVNSSSLINKHQMTDSKQEDNSGNEIFEEARMSPLENGDFQLLCGLLNIKMSNTNNTGVLSTCLSTLGIEDLSDFALVQNDDLVNSQELSPILRRKLLSIVHFVKAKGAASLRTLTSFDEVLAEENNMPFGGPKDNAKKAADPDGLLPKGPTKEAVHTESSEEKKSTTKKPFTKEKMKEKAPDPEPLLPEVINLNVGGKYFTTTRETLCRVQDSMLESMFSGRHPLPALLNDGHYIIDRDGDHFQYILNFLRADAVMSLPTDEAAREALAVEADYYGIDEVANACRTPLIDTWACLPKESQTHREEEGKLRDAFAKQNSNAAAGMDPHCGLIALFDRDHGEGPALPLKYEPVEEVLDGMMFHGNCFAKPGEELTIDSKEKFVSNFNRAYPNMLNRLSDILKKEPVFIAGGSVLRSIMTTSSEWKDSELGDIDLFLHSCDAEEATRIATRIFYALAVDDETWVVVRSRGVLTIHNWHSADGRRARKTAIVQVVLRLYSAPAEVLLGFDCDSCCCG